MAVGASRPAGAGARRAQAFSEMTGDVTRLTGSWHAIQHSRHSGPRGRAYPAPMATVDLVDETFIVVAPARIAEVVADPGRWRSWWPGLHLVIFMDRGLEGVRWTITGELVGSAEIWLESHRDGVLVHHYLRAEPTEPGSTTRPRRISDSARGRRVADTLRRRHALAWKRTVWALKDELEGERRPGEPVGFTAVER